MFSLRHRAAPALAAAAACLALSSGRAAAAQSQPAAAHIDRGTQIVVRTTENIDQRAADGRIYAGEVDQDVLDQSGRLAIPRGSPVELEVRGDDGELILDLESVVVNGQRYAVRAASTRTDVPARSDGHSTATYVGGGAILGTIIGAIAGGGKGAAIGAATGAAAGAGAKILTRGREVVVPDDTILTFQLQRSLDVDVPDGGFERDSHHYHRYPR